MPSNGSTKNANSSIKGSFDKLGKSLHNTFSGIKKKIKAEIAPKSSSSTTTPLPSTTNAYQASFNNNYIGCYRDNPVTSYFKKELSDVTDISQCINQGKSLGYKYVGLSNGNKCRASNDQTYATGQSVTSDFCNTPCLTPNTGNCGGTFFNQVYNTGYTSEGFDNIMIEDNFTSYVLTLIVILLLLFLLQKHNIITF